MSYYSILLITVFLVLYLTLSLLIIAIENQEEVFMDSITWSGTTITLGDEVLVETPEGFTAGFFRGLIRGQKHILRLSCEGQPRVDLPYQDIISIKMII